MSSRLHALSGFQDGLSTTLSLIDRVDEERDEDRLEAQQAEDRQRQLQDLETARMRNDVDFRQRQEDRKLRLSDDEAARERQAKADDMAEEEAAHLKALRPLERRRQELLNSGILQEQTVRDAQIKDAKRADREREAMGYIAEAQVRAQAGDHAGAQAAYKKLGDYGFDVEGMSSQEQSRITDTMVGLEEGSVDVSDPDALWLAKQVLLPSMATSGRNPDEWELVGLVPNEGRNTFSANLMNKKTGDIKPATMLGSTDDNDPVTEFTIEDLMNGGKDLMELEQQMMATNLAATGARLGLKATQSSDLDRARARKANAEAEKLEAEIGAPGDGGYTPKQREIFVKNYADTNVAVAAEALTQESGFTPERAATLLESTQKVLAEPVAKNAVPMTQMEAMNEAVRRAEASAEAAQVATKIITDNAGLDLDEDKVLAVITKHKMNPLGSSYEREIKTMIERAQGVKDRQAAREARKAEREKAYEASGTPGKINSGGIYGDVERAASSTPFERAD